jgi:heme A synthase
MTRLVRYAWFVLGFNVAVILLGALVRATGSGAGCGRSWPTCHGQLVPELSGATVVEYTHRLASGCALVLVAILIVWVWRSVPKGAPARKGATAAGVSIAGEALIGAAIVLAEWVGDDTSIARAVAVPLHLVNTLVLLAALSLTVYWLSGGGPLFPVGNRRTLVLVAVGGLAIVLIAATGAVTALADTLFPKNGVTPESEHFLTRLRIVHPVLAVIGAGAAWWASSRVDVTRSRATKAVVLLVGAMMLTGVVNIALGTPVWMQLTHLLLADLLWIAYVFASAGLLDTERTVAQPVG